MRNFLFTLILSSVFISAYAQKTFYVKLQKPPKINCGDSVLLVADFVTPVSFKFTYPYSGSLFDFQIVEKSTNTLISKLPFFNVKSVDTIFFLKSGDYYLQGTVIPSDLTITGSIGGWSIPDAYYQLEFKVDTLVDANKVIFKCQNRNYSSNIIKVAPNKSQIINVSAIYFDGSTANDSVKLIANPLTVNSGVDKTIICGGKVTFDNLTTNYTGLGTLTYAWTPSLGLDNAAIARPTAEITSNTNFSLQVSTPNGCIAKDTVKVTVNPFTVNSGLDKSLICGGSVQLDNSVTNYTGSGTLTYAWTPNTGLDDATIVQPTAEVTTYTNFALQVLTPNGCIAKDTVIVTVNPFTVNSGLDKSLICGGKVQFDNPITNYTGTGALTYAWLPSAGLDNAAIASPTAEVTTNTNFALQVSTPNGCIAKDTVKVTVNPLQATANDISFSCGNTVQLNVSTNYTGLSSLLYKWTPSLGLSATNIANPLATLKTKNKYSVEVKTLSGCYATANVNVNPQVIGFNPSICMVSVNENDKNVIVWQRENNMAIDSFFIFRESTSQTNQYDLIGKLPFAASGVFVDTLSNARVQSNKYKIATKDVCGFLTDKSAEHKTMHLTINKGIGNKWNLIWEQYVGLTVSSYKIYRGTTKANLVEIGSSAGGNTTYTDETAPTGDVYYQIGVVLPQACTNLKSTGYESSRSNIMSSADAVTGIANTSITETFIYPNPAFDKLNIFNTHSVNATVIIFDLQGKQVLNKQVGNGQVDISNLSNGIYTVRLIDSGNIMINKLIKQ